MPLNDQMCLWLCMMSYLEWIITSSDVSCSCYEPKREANKGEVEELPIGT